MVEENKVFFCAVLVSALVCLNSLRAEASRDTDSDGLPDELEKRLGMDPAKTERRALLCENPRPAGGAGQEAYAPRALWDLDRMEEK